MKESAHVSHIRLLLTKQHCNHIPFDPDPETDFKHFTQSTALTPTDTKHTLTHHSNCCPNSLTVVIVLSTVH